MPSHMAEILNRLTEDRQQNVAVFDLLASSLRLLADGIDPFHVTRHYELALLALLGFRPELYRCVSCGEPLPPAPHRFASSLGGFLCQRCHARPSRAHRQRRRAEVPARARPRRTGATIRLRLDHALRAELEGALAEYLRQFAEHELGSLHGARSARMGETYR